MRTVFCALLTLLAFSCSAALALPGAADENSSSPPSRIEPPAPVEPVAGEPEEEITVEDLENLSPDRIEVSADCVVACHRQFEDCTKACQAQPDTFNCTKGCKQTLAQCQRGCIQP